MSFLSFEFALFVGVALLIFHLGRPGWRPFLLLALSYIFYLTWSPLHALLLAAVTTGVYGTALWIESRRTERGKGAWMALGVMALLVLLFAFKSAAWWFKEIFPHAPGAMKFVAPLGLSYYVFKMLGYLLDVYWEVLPAQRNYVTLALYGAFFPQIVSGPIQRAQSFFEQIKGLEKPDAEEFATGLRRILFGLFKKLAVADPLSVVVANVHANPAGFSPLELLAGAYCYWFQLYADFSAITDMAIGIGLLFGVRGPENFDLPYFSPNIPVFWRRWHMSLTTWLTDYLFTPLRMSLRTLGTVGLCLAIMINTVAIGLWHGLAWTFLAFGILHGIFVSVSVLTQKRRNLFFKNRPALAQVRQFAAPFLTFNLVAFSFIFFRAASFSSALEYIARLIPGLKTTAIPAMRLDLSLLGISASALMVCAVAFLAGEAVTWAARRRLWVEWFFARPVFLRRTLYYALITAVLFLFKGTISFIYARF